jgi:SAM-dependent methyltransferase
METCACDLCGSADERALPRRMTGARRTVVCQRCGLVFTNPRRGPAEIERVYAAAFPRVSDPGGPAGADPTERTPPELDRERELVRSTLLPLMTPYARPAGRRWLDVRFRTGALLEALQKGGAEVHGVDPFERNVSRVREQLPAAKLHFAPVHDLLEPVGTAFDVISMMLIHVAAHVPSPTRLLRDAFDRLVPGGVLLLGEKDITRIPAHVPQFPLSERAGLAHYHHLTLNSLRAFVEKVGFEIVHADYIARSSVLRHFMIVARRGSGRRTVEASAIRADDPRALRRRLWWLFLRSRYRSRVEYPIVVRAHRLLAGTRAAL